jgi:hypothetical protein
MGSAVGSKDFGIDLRDRPPPSSIMGSGSIEQSKGFRDFLAETGRSATNPYGNESTFQKLTGLKNLNYLDQGYGGLTSEGIARLNRLAYDKFMNPYAQRDVLGNTGLGGDMLRGKVRSGIRPGTLTRYGMTEAAPSRGGFFAGLASLIPGIGTAMNMNRPSVLPGFDMAARSNVPGYDESKLAQLQRLSPEIGTDSVGELPTLSQLLADDTAFTNRETAGESPAAEDVEYGLTRPDGTRVASDFSFTSSKMQPGSIPGTGMGTFATDLGAPTFQGRPDIRTANLEDLSTDQLIEIIESRNSGTPVEENPTPVYEGGIAFPDFLPGATMTLNPPGPDVGAPIEIIPPVSDVISDTSGGQPLSLIPPGVSEGVSTPRYDPAAAERLAFNEMMRRRRGSRPIIAQPL